jgi:hypothetical protein
MEAPNDDEDSVALRKLLGFEAELLEVRGTLRRACASDGKRKRLVAQERPNGQDPERLEGQD